MNPLVSAVVLNFRSPQETVRCVQNLLQQKFDGDLEVIVVDNHSEDDSIGVIRNRFSGLPLVRIVESRWNAGFGKGYKQGIQYARGTYLLINNPDKNVEQGGIARMVAQMEVEPDIGLLAPKLLHGDGTARLSPRHFPGPFDVVIKRTMLKRLFPRTLAGYLQLADDPDRERDADWVAGGCFMIRRDFFAEIRGFDDRFFLFFEDTDLCRRVWQAGKRVRYFPSVTATDKTRRLSEGSVLSLMTTPVGRAHVASAVKYFWKWRGKRNVGSCAR